MEWPTPWDWVGILLAIIGILMAVQPFLQIVYGQPKLSIRFTSQAPNKKEVESIGLYITNELIRDGWLARLGITRQTAEDVIVNCTITDTDSGEVIIPIFFLHIHTDIEHFPKRASIPASKFASYVPLGFIRDRQVFIDKGSEDHQLMAIGKYSVRVTVAYGSKEELAIGHLTVQDAAPYGIWKMNQDAIKS